MRILLFGTCFINNEEKLEILKLWIKLAKDLHRVDWLLIDSESPNHKIAALAPYYHIKEGIIVNSIVNLGDNIGHLCLYGPNGQDGWGRALCCGLGHAIDSKYDYAIHMEGDLLSKINIANTIQAMLAANKKVAAPMWINDGVETGLMCMDVNYIKNSNFISQYNWRSSPYQPVPEVRIHQIFGNNLLKLNLAGCRNENKWIEAEACKRSININLVIKSLAYITHASIDYYRTYVE